MKKNSNSLRLFDLHEIHIHDLHDKLIDVFYLNFYNEIKCIKVTRKIILRNVVFTTSENNSKHCDFCVKNTKNEYGLIEKIIQVDDSFFFVLKKIVKLINSFYSPNFPNVKSHLTLASVSEEYFIEKIEDVTKTAFLKISNDLIFVSDLNISHLFL